MKGGLFGTKPITGRGVGEKCPDCGEIGRNVDRRCAEAVKRNAPPDVIIACRCLHPGDYSCMAKGCDHVYIF